MWHDYRARTLFIAFQAFLTIILLFLWLVTGDPEALYVALVFFLLTVPIKLLKGAAHLISPGSTGRPAGAKDCKAFPGANEASETGMPSGHAAGAAAMATYAVRYIWTVAETPEGHKALATALVAAMAAAIAYSRIVYSCHTWAQVLVGAGLGYGYGELAFAGRHKMVGILSATTNIWSHSQ